MPEQRGNSTSTFIGILILFLAVALALVLDEISPANKLHGNIYIPVPSSVTQPVAAADSLPLATQDSLFSFHINYNHAKDGNGEPYDSIRSIDIIRRADHKKNQTVIPPASDGFHSYIPPLEVEDMNFDGYLDFRVLSFVMMRGQCFYNFWLYDPQKEKFALDTFLTDNMWDVRFDHETKTVISDARLSGPFGGRYEEYTWKNGKLVLQLSEECEEDLDTGNGGMLTIKKKIDGKMVTRSKYFKNIPFTKYGQVIYEWDSLR